MSTLKFVEITEAKYRSFWNKSDQKCFLSAPEISCLRDDYKVLFYGVEKEGKIVAAAMIRGTKNSFGYNFYSPRGILVDYSDKKLLNFFVSNLKETLKNMGGYVFRIDPNVEFVERDIDGNIVEGGYNNEKCVENLKENGFSAVKYVEGVSQITWEFVLPVKGKTEEEILSNMKSNSKRRLKQALTYGIKIKDLKREGLGEFFDVLRDTASRKDFNARDLAYFEKMYDLYGDKIQFVSAVICPKEALEKLQKDKEEIVASEPKTIRERKDKEDAIKSIDVRIGKIEEILADADSDEITLSSGMFFTDQPEILHLFGGNVGKYIKLDGQYILQWEMIRRALHGGYQRYNFYGIPENINTHPENYGVYEFKRGFGGKVIQLIGEFEMPLSYKYSILRAIRKIKKLF